MESHKSDILKPLKEQFYKLYYPNQKINSNPQKQLSSINSHKSRSKSMMLASVLHSIDNQQLLDPNFIKPKHPLLKKPNHPPSIPDLNEKDTIIQKYREKYLKNSHSADKITFKKILSSDTSYNELPVMIPKLPLRSLKDLEEFSSKSIVLKSSLQHFRQQKSKLSRVVLSVRQSQQTKLTFLQSKKHQLNDSIHRQTLQIYQKHFKKDYESRYPNKSVAFLEYQKKIGQLVRNISKNVFK